MIESHNGNMIESHNGNMIESNDGSMPKAFRKHFENMSKACRKAMMET